MDGLTPTNYGERAKGPEPLGMSCPVCRTTALKIAKREGVEIDYCPKCRGVWLDRGELDKILDRSAHDDMPPPEITGQHRQARSGNAGGGVGGGGYAQPPQVIVQQPVQHVPHPHTPPPGYVPPEQRDPKWKYDKYGRPKEKRSWMKELFDLID